MRGSSSLVLLYILATMIETARMKMFNFFLGLVIELHFEIQVWFYVALDCIAECTALEILLTLVVLFVFCFLSVRSPSPFVRL